MTTTKTNNKVRMNEIKIGDTFKKSESYFGTTTFKSMSNLKKMNSRNNDYYMKAEVVKTTGDFYKVGSVVDVYTTLRQRRFGKVTLITK